MLKIEILKNVFEMILKVAQQQNYHLSTVMRTLAHLVSRKSKKLLKNFILSKTCFSDAETYFLQTKILKISTL